MAQDLHIAFSDSAWTGVIVALPQEAQCLGLTRAKPGRLMGLQSFARVVVGGMGELRAERAAQKLLAQGARALMSFGLAGALDPCLRPGALLIPRAVICRNSTYEADASWHDRVIDHLNGPEGIATGAMLHCDEPLASVRQKHAVRMLTDAIAVDMESGAIARIAREQRVPFLIVRAVADPAWRALPRTALAAMDADGRLRPFNMLKSLLRRPSELGDLHRLAADYQAARRTLSQLQADFETLSTPL